MKPQNRSTRSAVLLQFFNAFTEYCSIWWVPLHIQLQFYLRTSVMLTWPSVKQKILRKFGAIFYSFNISINMNISKLRNRKWSCVQLNEDMWTCRMESGGLCSRLKKHKYVFRFSYGSHQIVRFYEIIFVDYGLVSTERCGTFSMVKWTHKQLRIVPPTSGPELDLCFVFMGTVLVRLTSVWFLLFSLTLQTFILRQISPSDERAALFIGGSSRDVIFSTLAVPDQT